MEDLTPEQQRALGRIQLLAVVVFVATIISLRFLARSEIGNFWLIAAIALGALYLLMFVLLAFAARVERMTYRAYVARLARRAVADLRSWPSRQREKVKQARDRVSRRR